LAFVVLSMLGCEIAQAADVRKGLRIELAPPSKTAPAAFEVVGLADRELAAFAKLSPERQAAAFGVFVDGLLDDPPPVGGGFEIAAKRVRFVPRYPLEPGLTYRAVFDRGALTGGPRASQELIREVFPIAQGDIRPKTVVTHIYPSVGRLPENHLKFYIHFSAPMSRGEAYRHVHLIDADGKEVENVFLELGEELWDGNQQRFTLLFDPGRVKRGLQPREELGPVLVEGRTYSLMVDADWRDAAQVALKDGAKKTFSVGPPDEKALDPAAWRIESPAAGSAEPLVVRFGEPLDHAQIERVVWVATESGQKVPGSISTSDDETCWRFTPARAWAPGRYQLVAETTLEDLAGNSIGRPFEVDEFDPVQKRIETKSVSIPFTIGPAR
jgi:hypothetical protein